MSRAISLCVNANGTEKYVRMAPAGVNRLQGIGALDANPSGWNGAQGRSRTTDTAIFSRMLYQLSYLGTSFG